MLEIARQVTEQTNTLMSNAQFYMNMVKMTIMWCASSFSYYLLNYMNKYLEGSIYQNHCNEGIAGLLAIFAGAKIYSSFGKKKAFLLAFTLAFTGGFLIYLLESEMINFPASVLQNLEGRTS